MVGQELMFSLQQINFLKWTVFDLETIPIFHPHYHTHSGNASRPVNLAVVSCVVWLVSYEDENEYGNDNGNEIEDCPTSFKTCRKPNL